MQCRGRAMAASFAAIQGCPWTWLEKPKDPYFPILMPNLKFNSWTYYLHIYIIKNNCQKYHCFYDWHSASCQWYLNMPLFGNRVVVATANYKHIKEKKKDLFDRETRLGRWVSERRERKEKLKKLQVSTYLHSKIF